MANIINSLKTRMITARGTNKAFPCKTYATEAAAEKATAKLADEVKFCFDPTTEASVDYVVFYIAEWDRWVGAINQTEVFSRPTCGGGYVGLVGSKGFFAW